MTVTADAETGTVLPCPLIIPPLLLFALLLAAKLFDVRSFPRTLSRAASCPIAWTAAILLRRRVLRMAGSLVPSCALFAESER